MRNIILFTIAVFFLSNCNIKKSNQLNELSIDLAKETWFFKQTSDSIWMPADVPGTVHTDLMALDSIGDSFYRLNEKQQQWIDKTDWEYKTQFIIDKKQFGNKNIDISFLGLDTYTSIFLNNKLILSTENMFRTYNTELSANQLNDTNILRIVFHSPINKGLELIEQNGYQLPANNDQSENGGVGDNRISPFVRKAPYHFGWDWGPRLVTSGIWKPIILSTWEKAKVTDLYVQQNNISEQKAEISINAELEASENIEATYKITNSKNNQVIKEGTYSLKAGYNKIQTAITIENPELWWPNGYGEQNMYNFKIEVFNERNVIASKKVKTGLRSIKLVREADDAGTSFYFNVNGKPVFAKGANYIPNDNFVTRVSNERYAHILQSAVDANMNMLRIWGGGIYEYDVFYEVCDSLGIMIWQDFMFACSMYPGNDAFLSNIKAEAIDNVKRLRNHPCIALWCGNNEIEAAWPKADDNPGWGWKKRYTKEQAAEIWNSYDTIFYSILADVVKENHSEIYYWPSSPLTDYQIPASHENTSGDMHYWGVWHGLEKFDRLNEVIPRFMSEFGFQSFPDFQSVKKYTIEEDWDIESEVMASHQRSGIGNLRIKEYMSWDYKIPTNFEQFLYVGQVLQAEGMRIGLEAQRRNKPYCMGTLYWQHNDCWPVASWSSMDYYGKWKALHYFVKKAYSPYLISMIEKNDNIELWLVSDEYKKTNATLKLSLIDFSGKVLYEESLPTSIDENASVLAKNIKVNELIANNRNNAVLYAELFDGKQVLATNNYYFAKTKDLNLEKAKPKIEVGDNTITVTSEKLIKNLYLFTNDGAIFSDNYFDVIPGKEYKLTIKGKEISNNDIKIISIADTY